MAKVGANYELIMAADKKDEQGPKKPAPKPKPKPVGWGGDSKTTGSTGWGGR